ncbi:MAG TPA: lysophospholipid acyltransferase family protein [Marmoricola sp.]|nr:lysophospholipid acyltransferase family protein [Marmoricola sp.]HNN47340.1 lysophospholipid acyltransferase family protein [Marmoricola sp.]
MSAHYRIANTVFRTAMRALAVEVNTEGLEHVPRSGPVIFAATHVSYPDFVFIQEAASRGDRWLRFMSRYDVWNNPWAASFMNGMRHIPVDRSAPAAAYLRARELLAEGEAVAIFPEAGISYSFTVRPLMKGVAALARATGATVIPTAVWGSQRIYSVGDPEPPFDRTRGRRVDVLFGEPLVDPGERDLREQTEFLGHTLTQMLEELQLRDYHRPRPGEFATWYPAHLGGCAPTREQALNLDEVPRAAVLPTWGPDLHVFQNSEPQT